MRLFAALLIAGLGITGAQAAGIQFIEVPAADDSPLLTGTVWSPCAAPAREVRLRNIAVPGVKDCSVVGDGLPLVVVSHGRTGWAGGHHDTAAALANAGFVVAAINHPVDSSTGDMSRLDQVAYLTERPLDIKRLIDFMLGPWPAAARIDRGRIGFFGFSRGGYTGLVLAGAEPDPGLAMAACGPRSTGTLCQRILKGELPARGYVHDARIKAAVIADPAPVFFFAAADLGNIRIPLQLWASEHGGQGASAGTTAAIGRALPSNADYRVVGNAAHFVFLAPCSPAQTQAAPKVCVDAAEVDRNAFHSGFNVAVVGFLRNVLQP